jgi:cell division protein FtsL
MGFVLLASTLVGSMVFGIVVVNVLLAQTSFRIGEAERRLEELSEDNLELVREQATLSAPGRISAWASRHGMRLPDDIRILYAPGSGSGEPAGADPSTQATDAQGTRGPRAKGDAST